MLAVLALAFGLMWLKAMGRVQRHLHVRRAAIVRIDATLAAMAGAARFAVVATSDGREDRKGRESNRAGEQRG